MPSVRNTCWAAAQIASYRRRDRACAGTGRGAFSVTPAPIVGVQLLACTASMPDRSSQPARRSRSRSGTGARRGVGAVPVRSRRAAVAWTCASARAQTATRVPLLRDVAAHRAPSSGCPSTCPRRTSRRSPVRRTVPSRSPAARTSRSPIIVGDEAIATRPARSGSSFGRTVNPSSSIRFAKARACSPSRSATVCSTQRTSSFGVAAAHASNSSSPPRSPTAMAFSRPM